MFHSSRLASLEEKKFFKLFPKTSKELLSEILPKLCD